MADHEGWNKPKSSQSDLQNPKNGASPWKENLGAAIGSFWLGGSAAATASTLGVTTWASLAIGLVVTLIVYLQFNEWISAYKVALVERAALGEEVVELREHNLALAQTTKEKGIDDFVTGFNQAGVEIALGGADPFGQMAEAILKFPVTKLHEQLVGAMRRGWEEGKLNSGGMITDLHRDQFETSADRICWEWIQEMTEGKR